MITSLNQGQIFGANPSLEEFERQLEADLSTRAYNKMCVALASFGSRVSSIKQDTKTLPIAVIRKAPYHIA